MICFVSCTFLFFFCVTLDRFEVLQFTIFIIESPVAPIPIFLLLVIHYISSGKAN